MLQTLSPSHRLSRQQRQEPFWRQRKRKFILTTFIISILLQLLFLGVMSWLYGSVWRSAYRVHNFKVLYINYDGGVVGKSLEAAYQMVRGPSFPSFEQHSPLEYPTIHDCVEAVRRTDYWGAFVVNGNASYSLTQALQSGTAAEHYHPTNALTYVWNEVRYPPLSDEFFGSNFAMLVQTTRLAFNKLNGTGALSLTDSNRLATLQVLLNPILGTEINIMPTTQTDKLFFNTVSMVMPILMQFFLLLVLNGLSRELQIYSRLPLHVSGGIRIILASTFDCIAACCMIGYIWAFRETWPVTGTQYVLSWMVIWLLMFIHFLVLDAFTAFLPLPVLPFFLLTWIIINICSSISPFEANPGFYRIGYMFPANEAYTTLTDIWSGGAVPQLYRTLPVLFSWLIVAAAVAILAHFYRCHKAWEEDAKVEEATRKIVAQGQVGRESGSDPVLRLTPSQVLLQSAEAYRSVYGPSVAPPTDLWKMFRDDAREEEEEQGM